MIKKWKTKSSQQKKLFFEAFIYLVYFRLILYVIPFKKLVKRFHFNNVLKEEKVDYILNNKVIDIGWSVNSSSKYLPLDGLCLTQALTAYRMLRKRNLNGHIYMGVGKDDKISDKLNAHAWLKVKNKIITGGNNVQKYAVVAIYTWK